MNDIIYGIDLGTTNSIIGCNNNLISRLVSSNVNLSTSKCVPHYEVGNDIVGSYKVNMGLGSEGELSIKASSIVLSNLVEYVKNETGHIVKNVIISVPAYFSNNQRLSVRKAAESIGLNLINVINEPTAAAIHVCGNSSNILRRGVFIIYDLGGGTFDCSLVDSRNGKYHVVATDGCILGGDNLDEAITDLVCNKIGLPIYMRNKENMAYLNIESKRIKMGMQEAYISNASDDFVITLKLTNNLIKFKKSENPIRISLFEYKSLVKETFGRTINILSNLVKNKIPEGTDFKVIFVGGSTHCKFLCSYVLESAGVSFNNAEFDPNPDYTVAMGVIEYATSIQNNGEDVEFKDVTKQLSISDKDGMSVIIIPANTNIPCKKTRIVTNSETTDILKVDLYQGNSVISKNNEFIGRLEYEYGCMVEYGFGDVEVTVSVDIGGFITLEVEDIVNFVEKRKIILRGF